MGTITSASWSPADRHQWAIERGKEHQASASQRALLVYVAFRVGPENLGSFRNRGKITEETGLGRSTITRVLSWWVDRGVLSRTRQQAGGVRYKIINEANKPTVVLLDTEVQEPDAESNKPTVVPPIDPPRASNKPTVVPNKPTVVPIKELKENGKEQEKENIHSVIHDIREHLLALPEAKREETISETLEQWPTWAQSWPDGLKDAVPYYLGDWNGFMVDIVARVAQENMRLPA